MSTPAVPLLSEDDDDDDEVQETVPLRGPKKTREARGPRRSKRSHTKRKKKYKKKVANDDALIKEEDPSIQAQEDAEEKRKLRAEAVVFEPVAKLTAEAQAFEPSFTMRLPCYLGYAESEEDIGSMTGHSSSFGVDLDHVLDYVGVDDDSSWWYEDLETTSKLEAMTKDLAERRTLEMQARTLALQDERWADWAVAAAEAERSRRLVCLAELEADASRERARRQAWALEAIAGERRRRVGDDFLSATTANPHWFEDLLTSGSERTPSVVDDDYEIVCPYACFGCRHVCRRSKLGFHLAAVHSREDLTTGPPEGDSSSSSDPPAVVTATTSDDDDDNSMESSSLEQPRSNEQQSPTDNTAPPHRASSPPPVEEEEEEGLDDDDDDDDDEDLPVATAAENDDDDDNEEYVVVCPNAVMGCPMVCRRGDELQRHLCMCPYSDATRQVELAQRARWQSIVALQAEEERTRRVVEDARATLASAAARAARSLRFGGGESSPNPNSPSLHRKFQEDPTARREALAPPGSFARQAALVRAQQRAAVGALGGELAELWRRHVARAGPLRKRRAAALTLTRQAVVAAFNSMASALNAVPPPVTVELFGSCAYGLETPESDLDLVVRHWDVTTDPRHAPNATWVLHRLAQQLKQQLQVDRIIDRARVPIIRLLCGAEGVKVDLSLETRSHTGLAAAALCKTLVTKLPALAPAAVAVKKLLRDNGLNDPFTGGLPSYAVVLMLFYARLHSKHAEPCRRPRNAKRPFERSSTLRDSSWREATFADLLKKTQAASNPPPSDNPTTTKPPQRTSSQTLTRTSSSSSSSAGLGWANAKKPEPPPPPVPASTPPSSSKKTLETPPPAPQQQKKVYPSPRNRAGKKHWSRSSEKIMALADPRRIGEAHALEVLEKAGLPTTRTEDDEDAPSAVDEVELAETLLDFLGLFGSDFCPKKEGFSVRHGGRRLVIDGGRRLVIAPHLTPGQSRAHRNDHNILIEDPIDPRNNVGRSSYHVARALDLFKSRHDRLRAAMSKRGHVQESSDLPLLASFFLPLSDHGIGKRRNENRLPPCCVIASSV